MRQNANTRHYLKLLVTILCILLFNSHSFAQKRPPQNVRRVSVTCQYVIENGQRTETYWPIYQEIYDSLGRLHTEIAYDFNTHTPNNIIWHTFNGSKKVKTDYFRNDKLRSIEELTYNADSLVGNKVIKKVNTSDTLIVLKLSYTYDSKGNPIIITARTATGKRAYVAKSSFNMMGKEIARKVKVRKNFTPHDSILKLISTPTYDSIGQLISEHLTINSLDKSVNQRKFNYVYDKSKNLVELMETDEKGTLIRREAREYTYSRNRLSTILHYDNNDKLVKAIGMRYEIYRTNNRRNREIDY